MNIKLFFSKTKRVPTLSIPTSSAGCLASANAKQREFIICTSQKHYLPKPTLLIFIITLLSPLNSNHCRWQ